MKLRHDPTRNFSPAKIAALAERLTTFFGGIAQQARRAEGYDRGPTSAERLRWRVLGVFMEDVVAGLGGQETGREESTAIKKGKARR